jgi:hypothetical protein
MNRRDFLQWLAASGLFPIATNAGASTTSSGKLAEWQAFWGDVRHVLEKQHLVSIDYEDLRATMEWPGRWPWVSAKRPAPAGPKRPRAGPSPPWPRPP